MMTNQGKAKFHFPPELLSHMKQVSVKGFAVPASVAQQEYICDKGDGGFQAGNLSVLSAKTAACGFVLLLLVLNFPANIPLTSWSAHIKG